jgi:hypothetical protein
MFSAMNTLSMWLSIPPFPNVILKRGSMRVCICPNHPSFTFSFACGKAADVKVGILVNFHTNSITLIEKQLPFINFSLLTDNQTFSMPLTVDYCPNIQFAIIERDAWTTIKPQICKSSRIAFHGLKGKKIFGYLSLCSRG